MTDTDRSGEKRTATRTDLIKLAFIKKGEAAIGCLLQDVSETGARVAFVNLPGIRPPAFAVGDAVQLIVDDLGEVKGTVARVLAEGIALAFSDLDAQEAAFVASVETALKDA